MVDNDTANREPDQVPTGEDLVNRRDRGHDTPRRYDEPAEDPEPKDDSRLNHESACPP